ncbi:uncharacterized protein LOC124951312 isoform X1 [Vespa velutina]|uniref:uncharacterized protein LOC124951312 isoform X1 n=1 Tax=Vespa velutina TaxID=202808 RepID=UPI001FB22AC0|nr:uncharacterized protein LOC124951312 isoform X1 [Vespa velutina]
MNPIITPRNVESARHSLDLLCSKFTRQCINENNFSQSSHNIEESDMEITVPAITHNGDVSFVVGEEITIEHINTLKELQETLRLKDEKVAELKGLLIQRDAKIRELRKKLDMYRSVLPFLSPYGRSLKHRPQGDF